jgi:hypothetical protein
MLQFRIRRKRALRKAIARLRGLDPDTTPLRPEVHNEL